MRLPDPWGQPARWTMGKVRIVATLHDEDDPDLSYYGEWTDAMTVRNPITGKYEETLPRENPDSRSFQRFLPACVETGQRDLEHMESYGIDWSVFGVRVVVYKQVYGQWVELGAASLWGVELSHYETDNAHLTEVIGDLRREAATEARERLEAGA